MNAFTSVAAASLASATAVAAPSIVAPENPDAELLALGSELQRLLKKEEELNAKIDELNEDAWETAEMETGIRADDLSNLSRHDAKTFIDAHWVVRKANGCDALCDVDEKLWGEISFLIRRIEALPIYSLAGIGPKALAAACANPKIWKTDDWDDERLQVFFASLFAAVGMECPYKFEPALPEQPVTAKKPLEPPAFIADENGFAEGVPLIFAMTHHHQAFEAAKALDTRDDYDEAEGNRIVNTANNAVSAIDNARVDNLDAAALRAVYLANYWNDPIHEESGENAFPSLTKACLSFREFLRVV